MNIDCAFVFADKAAGAATGEVDSFANRKSVASLRVISGVFALFSQAPFLALHKNAGKISV
jgi:hypothetical protein